MPPSGRPGSSVIERVYQLKTKAEKSIALAERYGANNYHPLPVVLERGKGAFVWDTEGRRYFDMLSAYSALNQGHSHPRIVAAARSQLGRLSLTSRAFHNSLLGPFLERICALTRQERALPMNSGAEAVETAIKAMRLWGYRKKGLPDGRAKIIVCDGNFHGRTTTIVGFSSDPDSYSGFGPATPGFLRVPFGSSKALEAAITADACGFLVEPIQGEAGVNLPPEGYFRRVRDICSRHRVLFCTDEIQTGLGRTGRLFALDHEGVKPDLVILGKALSGGLYPISAVASSSEVLGLFKPGTHGSTFGGNPLACAIGLAALDVIVKEKLPEKAKTLGTHFKAGLEKLTDPRIKEVRGQGLLLGLELAVKARPLCELLMKKGLLAKETHDFTVRFAPPLVITRPQIDQALRIIREALRDLP
ncbi:MAG: ornithine--oxo-acid transaminase [Elusimicrobia bacterium]|nr:ornithine--oxo-acid transaminase [Elusimicrobiota bacterium]